MVLASGTFYGAKCSGVHRLAHQRWRGKYNMAVGLAKRKGPVSKVRKRVPLTKPLFPAYLDLVKHKDGEA